MNIFAVFGVVLLCVVCSLILRESGQGYIGVILISFCIIVIAGLSTTKLYSSLGNLLNSIKSINLKYTEIVIKSFGVAFVGEIGSDIIEGMGSTNVAKYYVFAAKVEILCLCIEPVCALLSKLVEMSGQVIG